MITRLLMCALVIALAGCAGLGSGETANERHDRVIRSVVGGSVEVLLGAWGPPNQSYESGNITYLRYTHSRIVPVPAPLQMGGGHNRFVMFGGGAASISCDYTFEIRNRIIISANYHGNGCR